MGERAGIAEGWSGLWWIYAGGEPGPRALLNALVSSTIGVASNVFSITVAALSLVSGQKWDYGCCVTSPVIPATG